MNKLQPCPFCGGDSFLAGGEIINWVACKSCESNTKTCETGQEAIAAWNRREGEWVLAKERLPEDTQKVLVLYEGEMWVAKLQDSFWTIRGGDVYIALDKVAHWMPLPKPPGGEK